MAALAADTSGRKMESARLTYSEPFSRRVGASSSTLIAAMLLLAILPGAVAIAYPQSAAILEGSLADARVTHVQRMRPNPRDPREMASESRRIKAPSNDLRALARVPGTPVDAAATTARLARAIGSTKPADRLAPRTDAEETCHGERAALARAGVLGLPPPVAA